MSRPNDENGLHFRRRGSISSVGTNTTFMTADSRRFADRCEAESSVGRSSSINDTQTNNERNSLRYASLPGNIHRGNRDLVKCLRKRLKRGCVFGENYVIESNLPHAEHWVFHAVQEFTAQKVVLIFCEDLAKLRRLNETLKRLESTQSVCKSLRLIRADYEFPHCLVIERGDRTLYDDFNKNRFPGPDEQRKILQDVLLALKNLHSLDLVHGDLKPEMIAWFKKDQVWKLMDLNATIQSTNTVMSDITVAYVAPERIQTQQDSNALPTLTVAGDMWSFGVIAFEVMTGRRYYGTQTSEDIKSLHQSNSDLPSLDRIPNEDARSLLENYLLRNPAERTPADLGLGHNFFKSADSQNRLESIARDLRTLLSVSARIVQNSEAANLTTSISVERFSDEYKNSNARTIPVPTMTETTQSVPRTVFVCRKNQSSLIRIVLKTIEGRGDVSLSEIVAVNASIGDEEIVMDKSKIGVQKTTRTHYEVVAELSPDAFKSDDLRVRTPCFGKFSKRVVQLTITLSLMFKEEGASDHNAIALSTSHSVYINVVGNRFLWHYHQAVQAMKDFWSCLPQECRDGVKGAVFLWGITSNFACP